ncbi:hypothetical protein [Rufibacter aurantiacus]|uniref:hypothetical protein n=1 Tax=Rufibacter aurantiacus TaxID=2817374 RepID=UPI001B310813|nr:hypothetical protein [Rufibacter aurantiacus]
MTQLKQQRQFVGHNIKDIKGRRSTSALQGRQKFWCLLGDMLQTLMTYEPPAPSFFSLFFLTEGEAFFILFRISLPRILAFLLLSFLFLSQKRFGFF